jgi:hypothetical protein
MVEYEEVIEQATITLPFLNHLMPVLYLVKTIHLSYPDIPLLHWGDLDVGGLRILAHLRRYIPTITPLAMNAETFKEHLNYGQALSRGEHHSLMQLKTQPLLQDCIPLIDILLTNKRKLEQEAIRPSWFLERV